LDAGFKDLEIIPMGADKVFLRSVNALDVSQLFNEAKDFFLQFFAPPRVWNHDEVLVERGTWVRIYGVPIHAWNELFFKYCAMDVGRLLRVDGCTLERERFDYARILLATSSLELINTESTVMVDGAVVHFKIVEEWGFLLSEDAC
jgi:hypothetical protein